MNHGGDLLVPVGDVKALARAMAYLLDRPEEVRRIGEQRRGTLRAYSPDRLIRLHEELCGEALAVKQT